MSQRTESCPWTDEFPLRRIKATEFTGSQVYDYDKKRITLRNMNGKIDTNSKYFNLIKVLKSSTTVIHWLIKLHNKYFVISQSRMYRLGEVCSVYESNKTGKYNIHNPIAIYMNYLDIESAADRFTQEYMAMLINTQHPDVDFLQHKNNVYYE